jgi:hypothetical protein
MLRGTPGTSSKSDLQDSFQAETRRMASIEEKIILHCDQPDGLISIPNAGTLGNGSKSTKVLFYEMVKAYSFIVSQIVRHWQQSSPEVLALKTFTAFICPEVYLLRRGIRII